MGGGGALHSSSSLGFTNPIKLKSGTVVELGGVTTGAVELGGGLRGVDVKGSAIGLGQRGVGRQGIGRGVKEVEGQHHLQHARQGEEEAAL